jgi:ribosomal protein L11 methyltransferase
VEVREEDADEACVRLFELGACGVERRDATTLLRASPGRAMLVASFEEELAAREAIVRLPPDWSACFEEVVGDSWRDEWKKHFEPFRISRSIVVRPPWRDYRMVGDERVVVLEPGRAFGTGLHETTMLVAEVLEEHASDFRGLTVLDVGTGSGILALIALAHGASYARAVDTDAEAIAVASENAERNGLADRLVADTANVAAIGERYPVVMANIDATTLVNLAPALTDRVAPGGRLILSGILDAGIAGSRLGEVRSAYDRLVEEGFRRKGEWVALVMRR